MSFSESHFSWLCNGVEALFCTLIFECDMYRRLTVSSVDGLSKAGRHSFLNCFKAAITLKYSR